MKNSTKKYLLLTVLFVSVFALTGCTAPKDVDGNVIMISSTTPFGETISDTGWFGIFVWPICQIINYSAKYVGPAGGIAIATILVNVLVLALTFKSQVQMQRMQLIQPELTKIQAKYEGKTDDQSKMKQAQEMQALYAKYKINPFGAMIGTFLQLPIIYAIFQAVQRCPAVTEGTFLGLSLSETPWNGLKNGEFLYIALFVVMMAAQLASLFLPQYLAKKKAKEDAAKNHKRYNEEPNPMQNSMYMMMIPILVISIMWPSGMIVYWTISSLVNICKTLFTTKVISKHVAI